MSEVTTKAVDELFTMEFVIPSYQRGYRWQDIQVRQLLDDLWESYQAQDETDDSDSWYCLQPLVVAPLSASNPPADLPPPTPCGIARASQIDGGTWTVIDGQQRLTTLFILLKKLKDESLWTISYETRPGSTEFLKNLSAKTNLEEKKNENPDFFNIWNAANTVDDWLSKHPSSPTDKEAFSACIRKEARFIWYETAEDHYDVFTRLNSGKISLSNAELTKALLLRETRFQEKGNAVKLQQLEVAGEWDRIEQALGNDAFWYFINPVPQAERFNATRIDFLFELVLRKGFDEIDPISKYCEEMQKNPYLGFKIFSEYCKKNHSEPEAEIWSEIQSVFRRIKSWHDNRSLYHYIGFLMNRKGENEEKRIATLISLLRKSENKEHSVFLAEIKRQCGVVVKGKTLNELDYNKQKDKTRLNDVLLLFNLALLSRQKSEQSRYPFNLHVQKKWSIEHIHAQNERALEKEDIKRLQTLYQFDTTGQLSNEDLELSDKDLGTLNKYLEHKTGMKINVVDKAYKLVFSGNNADKSEVSSGDDKLNTLGNLVLLGREENSALNNKMYLEKKNMLSEWEHSAKDARFVPLGTRMVFFKHFSPASTLPYAWTVQDGETYVDAIVEMIAAYTGLEEKDLLG